jgi:hypothetical protein
MSLIRFALVARLDRELKQKKNAGRQRPSVARQCTSPPEFFWVKRMRKPSPCRTGRDRIDLKIKFDFDQEISGDFLVIFLC